MQNENENAQEVVVEQEEQTTEEQTNTVTLTKAEYDKLHRKAIAYDVNKKQPAIINKQEETPKLTEDKIWEVADLIRQGYTKKDAEFLMANGGTKALEDPNSYASVALKGIMEQRRAEDAASQTQSGGGGDTTMPLPEEKMREMSSAELEKLLPHS